MGEGAKFKDVRSCKASLKKMGCSGMQVFAFAQPHKPIQHGAFGEGNCPSYFDFFLQVR